MSEHDSSELQPYQSFGLRLKTMRQKCKETAADVSGAVEINVDMLERFERGQEVPPEDILMLLINHFNLGDDEAVDLWELAGYDQNDMFCDHDHDRAQSEPAEPRMTKQPVVVLALDSRVIYANGAEVVADKNGIILSFTQFTDANQGPVPVSRVGMSYEQAAQVLDTLQRALIKQKYASERKSLPAPRSQSKSSPRNSRKTQQNE